MKINRTIPDIRNNYLNQLLLFYGVKDIPTYKTADPKICIQPPTALDNIKEGYELYKKICDRNGRILIICDCDCDGMTSAAIFYQYTKLLYPDIQIDYKLHEHKQHGLEDMIDWIEDNAIYELVVLPDSSSNDKEYHDRLMQYGIECLVLDHHLTDIPISNNAIVINNQLSSNYKNKGLTGAGVVYQFCRYLDEQYKVDYADKFTDLAALGIDGDLGSLLELENRAIIKKGFSNVQNYFFKILIDKQSYSMNGEVTPISVAFYIVPLINAMIRVGTMDEKRRMFEAFINGKKLVPSNKRGAKGTLEEVAIESARECTNARTHQNKYKEEAVLKLEKYIEQNNLLDNKILFVKLEEDFKLIPELNGLICMELSAKYNKPTIVARINDAGEVKGSIRGINKSELISFKDFLDKSRLCMYVQGR